MLVHLRLATFATALALPFAAYASDDFTAPFSSASTLFNLCGGDNPTIGPDTCKAGGYDYKLAKELDRGVQAALAKAPANVRPLLKRDQAFFYEMILHAADSMPQSDNADDSKVFADMLQQRLAKLERIGQGFGRAGVLGQWEDAFGSITVAAAEGGAYRLTIDGSATYGTDDERRWQCKATALLKPSSDGWLSGTMLLDDVVPPDHNKWTQGAPPSFKIRRQGATLRLVADEDPLRGWWDHLGCKSIQFVTATYFASGKLEASTAPDKIDTAFVNPTFDCTKPSTASDEEMCADPDLAENDQRLNRAWKALLPRLDEATRRALMEDQRNWVKAQAGQYPEFLHPAWDKRTYVMHYTSDARRELNKMQRERIALLEGFDETRSGLAGAWMSYTAILNVTPTTDGGLKAVGWKWEQGDWKGGCDYDMEGKVVGGIFRSSEQRKNPDTLERDHATLIVNRLDDDFAKKRFDSKDPDEMKCKRSPSVSSTARLFPAKRSPDIYDFGNSIR